MLRLLSLAVTACALGACASKNLPPEYAGLNEAAVLETYGYPVDDALSQTALWCWFFAHAWAANAL